MGWNYLSIPKLQRLHRWSLGMDKLFHPIHYNGCNYLSMLGLKLNHVSKRGHWCLFATRDSAIIRGDKFCFAFTSHYMNKRWSHSRHMAYQGHTDLIRFNIKSMSYTQKQYSINFMICQKQNSFIETCMLDPFSDITRMRIIITASVARY